MVVRRETKDLITQHWPRVQELFQKAIELPADQRMAWVKSSEADPAIQATLIAMLQADLDPASILAESAQQLFSPLLASEGNETTAPPDRMIGSRVGPYLIVERLGQGGMGTVYRAEHEGFSHQVALKVIRRGMNSDEIVRRFSHERQIVASLSHPNIARLFDGGLTDEGLPWFSMELVVGEHIDRYCESHDLKLNDRLALFASVCDAVQYAHARLVVHRDLKPGNILVNSSGVAKLLDFGIAKVLTGDQRDEGDFTRTGVRPMSPAHAAPEQIRGEPVTTATDVYALGVLLYELVTGTRPHGEALTGRALEEAILSDTPRRPGTIATRRLGSAAGDLDNIVMMALRKEPDRRYPSAGAFADDVRRLLSGHPVTATRDSALYRVRKFAGRNRAAVAATIAGLVITGASVGWYTVRLREERTQAQLEARKYEQVAGFLQRIFTAPDPMALNRDAPTGINRTAGQLLASAVSRIDADLAEQPAVRASLLSVLGSTYRSLGDYRKAVDLLERADSAIAMMDHPESRLQVQVTNALGSAYWELGDLQRAEVAQRRAYDGMIALSGPDDFGVAVVGNDLANVLWQMGRPADAEPLLAQTLRVFRLSGKQDDAALATAISNHAGILRELGKIDAAEPLYREAIAIKERALGPNHPSVANSIGQLATLLLEDRGAAADAESLTRRTLSIRQDALGARHPYVAVSLNELAAALRAAGKLEESERTFREALALRRAVLEPGHPHIAYSLVGLAGVLIDRNRPSDAQPLLAEALKIREKALPADHWLIGDTQSRLGSCLALMGRTVEALPLLEQGRALIESRFGAEDRRTREAAARLSAATGVQSTKPKVGGQGDADD